MDMVKRFTLQVAVLSSFGFLCNLVALAAGNPQGPIQEFNLLLAGALAMTAINWCYSYLEGEY